MLGLLTLQTGQLLHRALLGLLWIPLQLLDPLKMLVFLLVQFRKLAEPKIAFKLRLRQFTPIGFSDGPVYDQ
jgi:hypothetical protein